MATSFGQLFSQPVDGQIYAQPLYVPNVAIPGQGTHNVVFVNTENDSVFAFDADSNAGNNSTPLWQVSLIDTAHGAAVGATPVPASAFPVDSEGRPDCGAISPEIGSTSTPVIDPSSGTIYVEAYSYENGTYVHRLHALDISTGAEEAFGPATITGTVAGTGDGGSTVTFNPYEENSRPALLEENGTVYVAFASVCPDQLPFHGWVFAYDAGSLTQQGIFLTTPNGTFGGIWMTGDGLAADASGNIYTSTGNGTFDTLNIPATDLGDSVLKLTLNNGTLSLIDYFTPYDQEQLSDNDKDLASGGILLLPDQPGPFPHEMVAAGKEGRIYLINRDQFTTDNQYYCANCSSDPQIVQESASGYVNGMFSTPAYWNGTLYYWSPNLYLYAIPMANGLLNFNSVTNTQDSYGWPGANLSVSANGNSNGILWALKTNAYSTGGAVVLRAYDATNVSNRLYSSDVNPNDAAGPAVKFTVPTVINGKVYVGSANQISVYGLSSPSTTPTPTPATPTTGPSTTSTPIPVATPTTSPSTTPTPTPVANPTTSSSTTPTPTPVATSTTLFGTPTQQDVEGGTSASVTLPGGGQSVSSPTVVFVQCFVRAGNPIVTAPAGWSSFASNVDSVDAQYLIYKIYPAASTIDSSVVLNFDSGGVSFAAIEAVAYQGVLSLDVGPSEAHSTNSATATAPAVTTATNGDTIVWFYSAAGPFLATVSSVSTGSIESQFDDGTSPRNFYGCQAIAGLTAGTAGTQPSQTMTCSATESWDSGIVVALSSISAPTPTPTSTPVMSPTASASPASSNSPTASASPTNTANATSSASPTASATLTPIPSPTSSVSAIPSPSPTSSANITASASPTATASPTPTSSTSSTVTATPVATSTTLFGTPTQQDVEGGTSASVTLPGGGQSVSSPTVVFVQCFVRAGNPIVTAPAGWSSFASNVDSVDAQYLIYKIYPAASTIDSSVVLNFDSGGVSFAAIEAVAYQGVLSLDVGPSEAHSTNSATATAPAVTTATNGDTIVWFYSAMGPFLATVSSVSTGSIESQFDDGTSPRNFYGCQAIAGLTAGTAGTQPSQTMTCSATESWDSGIVVALSSISAPTPTPTNTPVMSPTASASPASSNSPTASASPTNTANATSSASPTASATLTPIPSPTSSVSAIPSPSPTSSANITASASPTATASPTPTSSTSSTVSATPVATSTTLFGTPTQQDVEGGTSASVTLPGGGQSVSSPTVVFVQCFVRAGNPIVTAPAGWSSFASNVDSVDAQYLIYKIYPAASTIDSSVVLNFDSGGVSFAAIEAVAYQGVLSLDVGPSEAHSTNSATATAPAVTTATNGDTIVWFYSAAGPFLATVSSVSTGSIESQFDDGTSPRNFYGCQAIAGLTAGTAGTQPSQTMTCSATESWDSGIVVALSSISAPTPTPTSTPVMSPTASASPASSNSPTASASPTNTANATSSASPTASATLTPIPSPTSSVSAIPSPSPTSSANITASASPTATASPTPTSSTSSTVTATPVATSTTLFGTPTQQDVEGGTSASVTLPGGGQSVSSPTVVFVQCFVRAGNPIVTAPAGWSSFASNVDSVDAQYLIYKIYPAASTIDSSVVLNFDSGGVSFAAIEAVAYQGVLSLDVGPSEAHSTNSATATAPAVTTATNGDTIVWFYSAAGPFLATVSSVSTGSIESQFDDGTSPRNFYGCQAIAGLTAGTAGTQPSQTMTCSATESWDSGIVVALSSISAPTPTPTNTPVMSPTASASPASSNSPTASASPTNTANATSSASPTASATLTPIPSPTST